MMETQTVAELSIKQLLQEIKPELAAVLTDVDPSEQGFLMLHQQQWIADQSPLKLAPKGRRTGITFAEGFDSTIIAHTSRLEGGDHTFYIGDTKDKGREFIATCAAFRTKLIGAGGIIERFEYDEEEDGNKVRQTSYRLVDPVTGNRIEALSSNPANIRGLQGRVIIDEAAFHAKVKEVMKAVNALLIGFGVIRIISSHNGVDNPFNELVQETLAGVYDYKIHKVTFDMAVANGLYERLARSRGRTPTAKDKAEWYRLIRRSYGSDIEGMQEELDAIPKKSAAQYLSRVLIESVVDKSIPPVVRLERPDTFGRLAPEEREQWIRDWLEIVIDPLLALLDKDRIHVIGGDFARSGDTTCLVPLEIQGNLRRRPPFIVELRNVPFEQQQQIYRHIISKLPRFTCGAFDAGGNGAQIAEHIADRFGQERIHQIKLSTGWYELNMPKLRKAFEDRTIGVPSDEPIVEDLRQIRVTNGVPMVPKETGQKKRHGDAAVAYALAWFASEQEQYQEFAYEPVTPGGMKRRNIMRQDSEDDDGRDIKITGGFRTTRGGY